MHAFNYGWNSYMGPLIVASCTASLLGGIVCSSLMLIVGACYFCGLRPATSYAY
jgi:hypothetical protein